MKNFIYYVQKYGFITTIKDYKVIDRKEKFIKVMDEVSEIFENFIDNVLI